MDHPPVLVVQAVTVIAKLVTVIVSVPLANQAIIQMDAHGAHAVVHHVLAGVSFFFLKTD